MRENNREYRQWRSCDSKSTNPPRMTTMLQCVRCQSDSHFMSGNDVEFPPINNFITSKCGESRLECGDRKPAEIDFGAFQTVSMQTQIMTLVVGDFLNCRLQSIFDFARLEHEAETVPLNFDSGAVSTRSAPRPGPLR